MDVCLKRTGTDCKSAPTGKDIAKEELMTVLKGCKDKVVHNHPKKQILKCVAAYNDFDLNDLQAK